MTHGELIEALRYNPLIILFAAFSLTIPILLLDIIFNKRYLKTIAFKTGFFLNKHKGILITLAFLYVTAIVIYRNLPE